MAAGLSIILNIRLAISMNSILAIILPFIFTYLQIITPAVSLAVAAVVLGTRLLQTIVFHRGFF